jgi:hypothetical protein
LNAQFATSTSDDLDDNGNVDNEEDIFGLGIGNNLVNDTEKQTIDEGLTSIKPDETLEAQSRLLHDDTPGNNDDNDFGAPIKEILYCSICSTSFDKNDAYGQHLNKHYVELANDEECCTFT